MFAYTGKSRPQINTLRPALERLQDFDERDRTLMESEVRGLAAWCGDCKTPSCATGYGGYQAFHLAPAFASLSIITEGKKTECPLGNDIPTWENLVAQGNFAEAYKVASVTNPWPDITGQTCPPGLCEMTCLLRDAGHDTGHIRAVERFIGQHAWTNGLVEPLKRIGDLDASIVIIGAGPAGYPVAREFARLGASVTFYDKNEVTGGLVTRGLPGFKIRNNRVTPYFDRLARAGVEFNMGTTVGQDIGFSELIEKHDADAVIIATGTYNYKSVSAKGEAARLIVQGIPYLQTQNRRDDGVVVQEFLSGEHDAQGKEIVIVGAGDTAFDAVGTAMRQGATKITLLVRGTKMRAIDKEIAANLEEAKALAQSQGRDLSQILDIRYETELGEVLGTKERITGAVLKTKSGVEHIPAQMVIEAIGSDGVDLRKAWELPGLPIVKRVLPDGTEVSDNLLAATPVLEAYKPVIHGGRGGRGGGLVGLFQMKGGFVPVYAVGDIALDRNNPHDKALIVTALRDGRNTVPDILYGIQHQQAMHDRFGCMILNHS